MMEMQDFHLSAHPATNNSFCRIRGKSVLITGAGGSIGSALVRAMMVRDAAKLILLDHSEFALYELEREMGRSASVQRAAFVLGNVGDENLLSSVFARHEPEIVFHAAAFKHVPLLERNPFAAIQYNVLGTYALIEAAVAFGVKELVQVSTDKAVDPGSIMGASKRIAELLLIVHSRGLPRMSAVRLGNVWASQGSVVKLFLEQIVRGGPLTVTDPDVSRYFMTMDEAVTALLSALEPRTSGTVLLAQLGEATRIVDLARRLLQEHGSGADIQFTGLRPGDKLTESLISNREAILAGGESPLCALRAISSPAPTKEVLLSAITCLRRAVATADLPALLAAVRILVPEYSPSLALLSLARAARPVEESVL